MKKSGLRKKIILPIALVLTGGVLTVSIVAYNSLTRVDADAVFDGITNIINTKTESDETFNIVEVVPDKSMATFGYLIDGQEPDIGLSGLATIYKDDGTGPEARAEYMKSVKERLSSIVDDKEEDNTKPLYYTAYEESYVNPDENEDGTVKEDSEWTKIDLAGDEVIPAGTKGYTMEDVGEGKGDYALGYEYEVAVDEDGNYIGDYEQNVDHYVYVGDNQDSDGNLQGGYYNFRFKQAEVPAGTTNKDYFSMKDENGNYIHKAYTVSKAVLFGDQKSGKKWEIVNAINQKQNIPIYALRNGVYVYIGLASDFSNGDIVWNDSINFPEGNDDSVYYQQIIFEYVSSDNIRNDRQYFEIDDSTIEFCPEKNGMYSGILDINNPYIECINTDSSLKQNGHFRKKENGGTYSYVGNGNGRYNLKKSSDGSLLYKTTINSIYIKPSIRNRDWFRKYVFAANASIQINVNTVTPSELNELSLDKIDLLYISESGLNQNTDITYTRSNDISFDVAKNICNLIKSDNKKLPVIIDFGKVRNYKDFYNGPCMYKLMGALSCRNSKLSKKIDGNDVYNGYYMNLDTLYGLNINYNGLLFSSEEDYPNGFLNGNAVYIIPSNREGETPFIMNAFTTALTSTNDSDIDKKFKDDAYDIGFGEIADYINSENKLLKQQDKELLHKKISKDVICSYIISYKYKREIATDKIQSLKILEIEPGRSNGYNKEENMYKQVLYYDTLQKWLGKDCPDEKNVSIKRMTSSEFVGHIDDIKQYDMVYIGLNIESFNTDSNLHTVYNDSEMNGLVYSNVGDVVVIDPANGHSGLLDTDYVEGTNRTKLINTLPSVQDKNYSSSQNTYRASGNDLTMDKVKALEDYLDAGYPIVFSYGFFSKNYESNINEYFIDNSSNMFQFLKYAYEKENGIAVDSSDTAYNLYNFLTEAKPVVNLTSPKNSSDKSYVELDEDKLSLEFGISGIGNVSENQSYSVKLYIDSNKDGKFSKTTEEISASKYKLYSDNQEITAQVDSDGNYIYNVSSGEKYKLNYDLPHGVNGLIQWKLVVGISDKQSRYGFVSGYVHEKVGTPEKIKVLQINTSGTSTYNLEEVANDSSKSHLSGILDGVKDYSFEFHTVKSDSDELKEICKNDELKKYNLLIMGYGEFYQIDNLDGDLKAIKEYVDAGNAVLVTHDTSSYYNFDNGSDKVWGLSFNKNLRDTVGMDRYGISIADSPLRKGVDISSSNTEAYNTIVNFAENNSKDIAYKPRSNRSVIIKNTQGFTFPDLNEFQVNNDTNGKYGIYKDLAIGKSDATNTLILNEGQITMYPCQINSSLALTLSGNPYYQLDMNQDSDGDGETDLVVWYALSNWGSNGGSYEVSSGDARNNYYLYTAGNITYNGMGRTNANWQQYGELQLFVNTMITAYDAALHAPELTLKEEYNRNSNDVNTIYATLDDAIDQEAMSVDEALPEGTGTTKDVYFTVTDTNNLKNQVVSETKTHTKFYIECSAEEYNNNKAGKRTLDTGGGTIYLQEVNWDIYSLNADGSESDKISPTGGDNIRDYFDNDTTYKIKVPISILPQGSNSIKVYAIAYSDICKNKNGKRTIVKSPETYKTFDVRRLGLADLD